MPSPLSEHEQPAEASHRSTDARHESQVVVGKLMPPAAPSGVIVRDRLLRPCTDDTRVLSIVAPAGYGKTIAAKQIAVAGPRPFVWLNLDLLDDDPSTFWLHLITALRWGQPCISDQPEQLLASYGAGDPGFLVKLITELEQGGTPAVLVVDGVSRLVDSTLLAGLTLLIERIGDIVRFLLVGRDLPELPVGRWRANGWVSELTADDLCFDDDEAVAAVAALPELGLGADVAVVVNRRVEGWPTGLVVGANAVAGAANPVAAAQHLTGADRLIAEYFRSELLDRLTPTELHTALQLSVLDEFDAELCFELLGGEAVPVVHDLMRRGLPVVPQPGTGLLRWHPLLREMMEHELRWHPEQRRALHHKAAEICRARHDLGGAHLHLQRAGDPGGAFDLVVQPVLALVNLGDRHGLAQLKRLLPRTMRATDAAFAFDVACAWIFLGNLDEADFWCSRADDLMPRFDDSLRLRRATVRGMSALLRGEIALAEACVAEYERIEGVVDMGPLEERFATTAARVMLAAGRLDDAARWVERVLQLAGPPVVIDVNAPALAGWLAYERGRLSRARALADTACTRAEEQSVRPHHGSSEALVVAGWCRLAAGDLVGASAKADAACIDAEVLGVPWNRIRSGLLSAEVRRLSGQPRAALVVLRDLREDIAAQARAVGHVGRLADEIGAAEARSLLDAGDVEAAATLVDGLSDGPERQLLSARVLLGRGASAAAVAAAIGHRRSGSWSRQHRLEAEVLLAAAEAAGVAPLRAARLVASLEEGEASGWVLPFLGHGPVVDALLQTLPLATLHPALASSLSASATDAQHVARASRDLTPRELRLLHFLPTHLSYAEIGERLFISVNTVKTNLKTLYRKLGATTRAEAVDLAAKAGLLEAPPF